MNSTFKREQRYLVIKVKDAKYYLDKDQLEQLAGIADTIEVRRKAVGLPGLECVVIESHWPEYEATWKAIEARVTGAQPAPSFADAYQGAMEEVAIWKKRALEAEELNRRFVAEINGPVYMGEPVQPAPSVPDGWKLMPIEPTPEMLASAWGIDACDIAGTYAAMLAAAPEAKPCP